MPPLTPYVEIHDVVAKNNINAYQEYCTHHALNLRPHIKTHKRLGLGHVQLKAGAVGITCQKISEAEVFVNAGFEDVLISYNLLGAERLQRLNALRKKARISVVADHSDVVAGYRSLVEGSEPLKVLIEIDSGAHRCGISSLETCLELAKQIETAPNLSFHGLMTYPQAGKPQLANQQLALHVNGLKSHGIQCQVVSSGGSPDMWRAHESEIVTEYRVGTYVYFDRALLQAGVCSLEQCALWVKATVVSRQGTRFMIDAGSKALTSDLMGCTGHGLIREYPQANLYALSEEHGHVDASASPKLPEIGDIVSVLPNHACPVSNLFDQVYVVNAEGKGQLETVNARGCVG